EKVICPPFVSLSAISNLLKSSSIELGAQDVYFEAKGAYTGEISPPMLAELCRYVIIGHSERRQFFHDTGEIVNKKIKAAMNAGLTPILCVGESLEENEGGRTEDIVTGQLASSLAGIDSLNGLVIAYEPIWAIGTGRAATAQQANATISLIRRHLAILYDENTAGNTRILYGGSVTAANTTELMQQPDIDGALVGGASLKAEDFISIVTQTPAAKSSA
ncbi:triose-phosphate isomerase, partial [Chloroflexota bacterium]